MQMNTRLVFLGMLLFLLSMVTGLLLVAAPPFVANPRGLLAGHLEAAMNGMFVIIVGLFFDRLPLSIGQARLCRGTLIYGTYANWVFTTLAGILGTSQATPLAGAGYRGSELAEQVVLTGLGSVALATVTAVVLLLIGIRAAIVRPAPSRV